MKRLAKRSTSKSNAVKTPKAKAEAAPKAKAETAPKAKTEAASKIIDKAVARRIRFNRMLDIYGALLTERQRRLAAMHFGEDLSFNEIASEERITRQAAYGAIRQATQTLEKFEKHLRLLKSR
ncbi:MAG: hypothetical protein NTX50_19430 [Candidatus Sumerlaeota bacterium]|nr:hypothetical protein [Candidatus Sumerlaeota bacterium]